VSYNNPPRERVHRNVTQRHGYLMRAMYRYIDFVSPMWYAALRENNFSNSLTGQLAVHFIQPRLWDKIAQYECLSRNDWGAIPHNVQTCSRARSASYTMVTGSSIPGNKAADGWSWPLASTYYWGSEWVEIHLHFPMCLHVVVFNSEQERDNFTLSLHWYRKEEVQRGWIKLHVMLAKY
jgi:hypothetical protein